MDSILLPRPLFHHIIIKSRIHGFVSPPQSVEFGLYRQRWLSSTCWSVGFSGTGAGNLSDDSFLKENENGSLLGAFDESGSAPFGTLDAEITPETIDFFVSDAEGDPDCPTEGFSSIEQALNTLRQGKFVIAVDDESGDVEGNLIKAASLISMKEEDLERLNLPLMSPEIEDEDSSAPTFTITVDAKWGTSTGVSASDRATTVLALSSPESKPEDFRRPGHVFPLEISQRYRRKRENLVERTAISRLPTKWGLFQAYCYRSKLDGTEHVAIVKGDIGNGQGVLVRVHSECLTGDIFGSARCDCGNQLDLAMQLIEQAGKGVVVYLRGHEGRGIGLGHKLRAYNLQDQGHDTVQANIELGLAVDGREYGIGAQILRDLGVQTMRLMTNNPAKFIGLKGYGLAVIGRVPILTPITDENKRYLETKRTKMGHIYGSDISEPLSGFNRSTINNTDSPEEEQKKE
ncbi:hypothetical protein Patl1_30851 [Pistacia atlantica]|uniref:Uncharacterized protein n=1 Tax=Pistacia atlantica TaxID=434234 RepID=A0ACC1A8S0_9ROSI|nr:hypothetical protein Patl1_30851 [Pistacia atlantica]